MAITKVCCTCLSFDVEMFSLTRYDIRKCFEKAVTNIKIELEEEILQNICAECLLEMRKFVRFKDKCLEANQRLREILSQSTHISEDLLKAERRKLYFETIISLDYVAVIPETKDGMLAVKPEVFEDESTLNLETAENSGSRKDIKVQAFEVKHNQHEHFETNQYDTDTMGDGIHVNSARSESEKVEDKTIQTHVSIEDSKPVSKSSQQKELRVVVKQKKSSVKKRKAFWKSDYAVQITVTEEQQKEELLRREMSESYLRAPFKCYDCVTGFALKEKYERHIELHNESRGALQCDVCKLRYSNLRGLRHHQSIHRKRYKCLTCGTITKTQKQAERHQNRHVGVKFECNHCDEKFKQEVLYRRHSRTAHPTDYVCDLCGDYFTSQVHLTKHRNNNKDCRKSPKNLLDCKMCDSQFLNVNYWYNHILEHSRKGPQIAPTECQICGHKTTTWNDWSYHIVNEHRNNRNDDAKRKKKPAMTFICDICGSSLRSKARLSIHIHTQHTHDNAVSHQRFDWQDKCEVCNKNILRTNMKRHMKTHTGEKSYKCDACAKCFTQAYNRDMHARKKHQIMPEVQRARYSWRKMKTKTSKPKDLTKKFHCPLCPKEFTSKHSLEMHDRSHKGDKPFSCDVCKRTYVCKYYLEVHKNIHTGAKPYACDLCDRRFHNKSYLQAHKDNHTGEKRYACDVCDRRFKLKCNLIRHGLVHTGAKNCTCDLCGKTFAQLNSLNLHISTVHLRMPHPPRKTRKKKQ